MYSLRLEDDRGEVRRVAVESDVYSIGRADDNDLVLTDINVSRHHARLEQRAIGVVLVDAGSSYGIRMNGVRAPDEVLLQGGEVFSLGDYRFELVPAEADAKNTSRTTTQRFAKVSADKQSSGTDSVQAKAVPGMEGEPGVHYTVALSEDESLNILLEMRRNMMSGQSDSSSDSALDDDDELSASGEGRRGWLVRTIIFIVLLGATAVLGWLLYKYVYLSDSYLGFIGDRVSGVVASDFNIRDLIPRS